ncbi:CHASE2 domain-containing protein [Candidatus Latescibacterota bacterium]
MHRVVRGMRYILWGLVVSVIVYITSQNVAYFPLMYIQNIIDDTHFKLRFVLNDSDEIKNNEIVIVDIDDRTLRRFGSYGRFIPRMYFGRVIGNIKNDNARLIFLDALMKGVDSPTDNSVLADSLRSAGNVFSGFYLELNPSSKNQRPPDSVFNEKFLNWLELKDIEKTDFLKSEGVSFSYHELIMSSERIGFTNCLPDPDGVVRHIPLYILHKKLLFQAISLELWQNLKELNLYDAKIYANGVDFGNSFIPTDKHSFLRINFENSKNVYKYVSFIDVLDGDFERGIFRNKIVMIGSSSPRFNDIKKIPGFKTLPGVEIHAAALSTMLDKKFLNVISGTGTFLITVICGIVASLFFSHTHPIKSGLLFLVIVSLIFYFAAVYCFFVMSLLINITIPVFTVILLWILSAYKTKLKRKFGFSPVYMLSQKLKGNK